MKYSLSNFFTAMNKGDITDTEMDNILDGIVDSLFSLFATLGNFHFPVMNLLTNMSNLCFFSKKELCHLFKVPKVMLLKWLLKNLIRSCVKA